MLYASHCLCALTQCTALIGEEEFAARYPNPINVTVHVPSDSSSTWELRGQVISVSIRVTQTVKELKDSIGAQVGGMPSNKQQLKGPAGFLKDKETLASLNIGESSVVELQVRSRGGKR